MARRDAVIERSLGRGARLSASKYARRIQPSSIRARLLLLACPGFEVKTSK